MMNGFLFLLFAALALKSQVNAASHMPIGLLKHMVHDAKDKVDREYDYSRKESMERVQKNPANITDSLRLMKQPRGPTRNAVRSADYMDACIKMIHRKSRYKAFKSSPIDQLLFTNIETGRTVNVISDEDMYMIAEMSGCSARAPPPSCKTPLHMDPFRTPTAVCNNRKNPHLGSSNMPFARWLPAEYQDGVSLPRGWNSRLRRDYGRILPLVRKVSNHLLRTANEDVESDSIYTHLLTIFGQWTDRDLTFTPISPVIRSFDGGIDCDKTCDCTEPCFPIKIPRSDPRFGRNSKDCIPFVRSSAGCGSGNASALAVRQQINAITAFIDVGQVYGSEDTKARDLRDLTSDKGMLRVNDLKDNGRDLLPFSKMATNMCATRRKITSVTDAKEVPCFMAGDERANENIGLTALHTMFLREHNRLARALAKINPHWKGERLFQETRKILGGYLQVITFRDYLFHIVGPVVASKTMLSTYPGYDENVDPSISNVFATAAYRFAHLNIQPFIFRLNETYQEHPEFPSPLLHRVFFTPWRVVFEGGVDPIIRGLVGRKAKLSTQEHMMPDELRERLFEFSEHLALDLASLNMQRGRDHGLPGYNKWRKFCGLSQPQTLRELARVLNNSMLAMRLISLYGKTDDIDVWMGGVSEPFVPGGRTGPLFACLIHTQFQRIRQGDRHWWENPGVFTARQRKSLEDTDLARIICDNTGITEVPDKPFLNKRGGSAGFTKCADIRRFNLSPWREGSKGFCEDPP